MMRAAAFWAVTILVAVANLAWAEDPPLGSACEDAVARGVWELAIDLCSPEMLPANASDATKAHLLVGRARAYQETGDTARAAADAAEARRLDPGSAAAFDAAEARRAQAKTALHQSLQDIKATWDRGEDERALAQLDSFIAGNPRNAQAYALRASIYLAKRDDGRAQADIRSATSLAKNCELRTTKQQTYILTCP